MLLAPLAYGRHSVSHLYSSCHLWPYALRVVGCAGMAGASNPLLTNPNRPRAAPCGVVAAGAPAAALSQADMLGQAGRWVARPSHLWPMRTIARLPGLGAAAGCAHGMWHMAPASACVMRVSSTDASKAVQQTGRSFGSSWAECSTRAAARDCEPLCFEAP